MQRTVQSSAAVILKQDQTPVLQDNPERPSAGQWNYALKHSGDNPR